MLINISDNYGHLNRTGDYIDEGKLDVINRDLDDILVDANSVDEVKAIVGDSYSVSKATNGVWSGQGNETFVWNGKEVSEAKLISKIGRDKIFQAIVNDGWDFDEDEDKDDFVRDHLQDGLAALGYWS